MATPTTAAGAKGRGLRAHLGALVAAALLPAFAVAGIAVGAAVDNHRRAFEHRLEGTAGALSSAVNSEIDTFVVALSTLATARSLDADGDLASLHGRARQAAALLGTRVFLLAPDLSMVLHTEFPAGGAIPAGAGRQTLDVARRAFETGRPAVGDLLGGRVTGRAVAPLYVPVVRNGEVVYALGAAMEAERFSRLLGEQPLFGGGGGYASLIDGQGRIMARSADHGRFVGERVRGWVVEGTRGGASGLLHGANLSGAEITTAFRRVRGAPDWVVTVAEPRSAFHASLRRPLATLAFGCLATLAIALVVAAAIGKRVLGPVDRLTRHAEAVAASGGGAVEEPPGAQRVRVREFARLGDAVSQAHAALRERASAVSQAHAALRERASAVAAGEARLRAVVDTAVDAIVVIDDRGTMLSFNPAAEAIFGHRAGEAVGRNVSLLVGDEHAAKHDGYLAAYRETGVRKAVGHLRDMEGRRKDGSPVPLDISIAEWRDAEGRRFFTGIMRDVSDRKADEARRSLLAREVDHRAKNALAVVQSVVRLSPRGDPDAFVAAVEARVAALARVHSLLAEGGWSGADLRAVAERELAAYAADGPAAPARRGFGSRVIEATIRGQLGGTVERRWERTGLVVEVAVPLARVDSAAGDRSNAAAVAA